MTRVFQNRNKIRVLQSKNIMFTLIPDVRVSNLSLSYAIEILIIFLISSLYQN